MSFEPEGVNQTVQLGSSTETSSSEGEFLNGGHDWH